MTSDFILWEKSNQLYRTIEHIVQLYNSNLPLNSSDLNILKWFEEIDVIIIESYIIQKQQTELKAGQYFNRLLESAMKAFEIVSKNQRILENIKNYPIENQDLISLVNKSRKASSDYYEIKEKYWELVGHIESKSLMEGYEAVVDLNKDRKKLDIKKNALSRIDHELKSELFLMRKRVLENYEINVKTILFNLNSVTSFLTKSSLLPKNDESIEFINLTLSDKIYDLAVNDKIFSNSGNKQAFYNLINLADSRQTNSFEIGTKEKFYNFVDTIYVFLKLTYPNRKEFNLLNDNNLSQWEEHILSNCKGIALNLYKTNRKSINKKNHSKKLAKTINELKTLLDRPHKDVLSSN